MKIYLEENVKLKKSIMASIDLEAHPMDVMKEMMFLNMKGMRANPILKEWYNRDVFSKIEQTYKEEHGLDDVDFPYDNFIEVVKKWQIEGKFRRDINAEMIMAIFGALINVDTHKDEIGIQFFPQILEYLSEFTMRGLMDCSKKD